MPPGLGFRIQRLGCKMPASTETLKGVEAKSLAGTEKQKEGVDGVTLARQVFPPLYQG